MKKILKYDSIIVFLIFTSLMIVPFFIKQLFIDDELWNFTNIYKMYNGYEIYKECNVIITPLFFYIGELFFFIFSPNMLVFRIYGAIINILLYLSVYELNKLLGVTKRKSLVYTLILLIFVSSLNFYGANYNNLVYIFVICGIICNIKQKNSLLKGFIIFLVFMTKQNIGIYYFMGICLYYLWDRENLKNNIKSLVIQFIVSITCFGFYCLYLYCNGSLFDFYDMAFCGVSEFAIKNLKFTGQAICVIAIQLMSIFFSLFIVINKKINLSSDIKNNIKLILCIAIPLCAVEYPLFNNAHLIYGAFFSIFGLIFVIDKVIISDIVVKNKLINACIFSIIIAMNCISIYNAYYLNQGSKYVQHNYEQYYGIKISEGTNEVIKFIYNYVNENNKNNIDTIIVSCDADLAMNVLKKNNNKFDLPFNGNLGSKGVKGLIEDLKQLKRTHIIINKSGPKVQEPKEVWDFIDNNFERISEWNDYYYIYKTSDL